MLDKLLYRCYCYSNKCSVVKTVDRIYWTERLYCSYDDIDDNDE